MGNYKKKKILLCLDSFKGTFSSFEAGRIISVVLNNFGFKTKIIPVADGGEGTLESLQFFLKGRFINVKVKDPLGRFIYAKYLIKNKTAVIEMAKSSGLTLLQKRELNPFIASSYGLGMLIRNALDKGCRKFYIGLGGSATNDAGVGMLQALGVKFLDKFGNEILDISEKGFGAYVFEYLHSFDLSGFDKRIKNAEFVVLSDVNNTLTGVKGTSLNYSTQKGADKKTSLELEKLLKLYKKVIIRNFNINPDFKCAGAAGGVASALFVFMKADIYHGIDKIIEILNLGKDVKNSDYVITGEGKIDYQTAYGKAPAGIASLAKKYNKPVIAICGVTGKNPENVFNFGIDVIVRCFKSKKVAEKTLKEKAEKNLKMAAGKIPYILKNYKSFKNKILNVNESN